jgi:hypothetical protein
MWLADPEDFARQHGLRIGQVRALQATAEHLIARCDGGTNAQANIVAAHLICNRRRHQRKVPLDPDRYRRFVLRRVAKHAWLDPEVIRLR